MKYRFLITKSKKPDYASLYQYLTTTIDGVIYPVEIEGAEALDTQVEKMLNESKVNNEMARIKELFNYNGKASSTTNSVRINENKGVENMLGRVRGLMK